MGKLNYDNNGKTKITIIIEKLKLRSYFNNSNPHSPGFRVREDFRVLIRTIMNPITIRKKP